MPRYLLIVDFQPGDDSTPMEEWAPAEVDAHLAYYTELNRTLAASGELVGGEILTGPDEARVVRSDGKAARVTEGPFSEISEWVAGYQIVSVPTRERALEIAALVSAVPGRGGVPLAQPVTVRRILDDGPADSEEMADWLRTV